MAHFSYVRPSGVWASLYVPVSSDYTQLDQDHFKSLNGDDGGTWTPSSPIILGGSGAQIPSGCTWAILSGGILNVQSGGTFEISNGGQFTLLTGGHATFNGVLVENGSTFYQTGSTVEVESGATVTFDNGATATFSSGALLDLAGTISVQSTGSISATTAAAGWLATNGSGITIFDSTNPTLQTPRTRSIVQTLNPQSYGPVSACSIGDGYFSDGGSTGLSAALVYIMEATKIINGAMIASVDCRFGTTATSPTGSNRATVSLWRVDSTTGAAVQVGGTPMIASGLAPSTLGQSIVISGLSEVIDDTKCSYYVKITCSYGTGAEGLVWFPPVFHLTNITTLGQF